MKIILFFLLTIISNGLTVAWDANPASDNITQYRLKVVEVFGMQSSEYLTQQTQLTITGLTAGKPYLLTVTAQNAWGLSEPSESLTVTPQYKQTFQFSIDLETWTNIITVTGPKGFIRIKIEQP